VPPFARLDDGKKKDARIKDVKTELLEKDGRRERRSGWKQMVNQKNT